MTPAASRLTAAKLILLLLLGFHALFQATFFAQITLVPGTVLQSAGVAPDLASSLAGLLLLAAAGQALLVVLSLLAIGWVWRGRAAGGLIGIVIGAYFLLLGLALASIGSLQFALIDITRGALTVLAGLWWGRGRASSSVAARTGPEGSTP